MHHSPRHLVPAALLAQMMLSAALVAAEPALPQFESDIKPVLIARCGGCHAHSKRTAKLDLTSLLGIARGGESGPVVEPGDVEASYLWQRIASDEMPPAAPLPDEERAMLRAWIAAGAVEMPRWNEAERRDGADHWAFHKPVKGLPPDVRDAAAVRGDVDRFIVAALEAQNLALSPEADRATLIRRVSFGLVGLPPTPEEIAQYLADMADNAYERMVERYLASPFYGQRWGKYWLDTAGYADSNGYFNADTDRPLAWRYRDWVVDSFNADRPWDEFLRLQIAGDVLAGYTPGGDLTSDMVGPVVATHFLRNAPDGTGESDGNDEEVRIDRMTVVEGTVNSWGAALLGMTVQCAKCHDHKFEPITQLEYYRLQAILFPTYSPDHWQKPNERIVELGTVAEREAHRAANDAIDARVAEIEQQRAAEAAPLAEQVRQERIAALEQGTAEALRAALAAAEDARTNEQRALLEEHEKLLKVDEDKLAETFPEFAARQAEIAAAIEQAQAERPAPLERVAYFGERSGVAAEHHLSVRGNHREPGETAAPGVPEVYCSDDNTYQPRDDSGPARRVELARWLTAPEHPITARIAVNRIWQHHFGRGLVETSDNLSYTGAEPSHPALLDYLAVTFMERGWSVKQMHRLILNSAVYRQSSSPRDDALAADPDNKLLARYPLRRLDAEALRDALLRVSGRLDVTAGGPYIATERVEGAVRVTADALAPNRRSIYLQQRRTQVLSLLEVFDAPSIVASCSRRPQATVPLQSLALLNDEFVRQCAGGLSERVIAQLTADAPGSATRGQQIERAYLLTLARPPRDAERQAGNRFFAAYDAIPQEPDAAASEDESSSVDPALHDFCQMVLASNAFLYVE